MSVLSPRWLVLSYAFNMDGRADSHTITDKIPHLLKAGVKPVVISARSGKKDIRFPHFQLLPPGPSGLRFEARHILRQRWGKDWRYHFVTSAATVALGPAVLIEKLVRPLESQWSWWWSAYRKGLELIRQGQVDLIYSTGGAFASHVAGAHLKKYSGLPWVAEIHDPLVEPEGTQVTAQQRIRAEIERQVCEYADVPIWFTKQALASARARNPSLRDKGRMLLPGADAPQDHLPRHASSEVMVLGHFGSLSRTRHLANVVQALGEFFRLRPGATGKIQLHVYGSELDALTRRAIGRSKVAASIRQFGRLEQDADTGKTGRLRALERMRAMDVLLLQHGTGPMCREYIPSKLYEYLWTQRPILGLVHDNPQLANMLFAEGHTVVESASIAEQVCAIGSLFDQWCKGGLQDNGRSSPYTVERAVEQLLAWVS